jgi:hypothetical protein
MRRLWRWIGVLSVVLLFATAAGAALPHFAFELLGPHAAKRSTAVLDEPLKRAVDTAVAATELTTVESAMDFALSATDKLLHFGLEHPTSASFTVLEREGNCIEYANLFARVFDKAAAKAGLTARAYAVHSDKARLFGKMMPMRGWGDHDWVLIQDGVGEDATRWFVDPTMHDFGLGWDISANVHGPISVDARPAAKPGPEPTKPLPAASRGAKR